MKTFATLCILTLLAMGCAGSSTSKAALTVWHSPSSTGEERLAAVSELIPQGTEMAQAKGMLGEDGRLTHRHGPRLSVEQVKDRLVTRAEGDVNEWTLDYAVPGGVLRLHFTGADSSVGWEKARFVNATFGESVPAAPSK